MQYIHRVGTHSSTPFTPKMWVKEISGTFRFLPESKYNLGTSDQMDWNKLCGISFNPVKPNDNAIMIGWRYNVNLNLFEVGAYFNVNGTIISFDKDSSRIQRFVPFEIGDFKINYHSIYFKAFDESLWNYTPVPSGLRTRSWSSFRVQPWFGGNRTAPSQVELEVNFK